MSRTYKHERIDEYGREVPDPTPMAPPVGYHRQPSITEQLRAMVRSEALASAARSADMETFEEADDFDIPDDPVDPSTPYESDFDRPSVAELKARAAKAAQEVAAAAAAEPSGEPGGRDDAEPAPSSRPPGKGVATRSEPRRRADIDD